MKLMLIMAMACFIGATVSATVVQLTPVGDTYVENNNPNENYGDADLLRIGDPSSSVRKSYTLWDASHLNAADIQAVESFEIYYTGGLSRYIIFRLLTRKDGIDDWDEMDITWNTAPFNNTSTNHRFVAYWDENDPVGLGDILTGTSARWLSMVQRRCLIVGVVRL